jgi:hypothetical protein
MILLVVFGSKEDVTSSSNIISEVVRSALAKDNNCF